MWDCFKNVGRIVIDGIEYDVDKRVEDYIKNLRIKVECNNLIEAKKNQEIQSLNDQLEEIRMLRKDSKLKPILSQNCVDCKYSVLSAINERPIACVKDSLCDDFEPATKKGEIFYETYYSSPDKIKEE